MRSGVRDRPPASAGTANSAVPSPVDANTSSRSAVAPSSTPSSTPSTSQPRGPSPARHDGAPVPPPTATRRVPSAIFGRCSACAAASPDSSSACAPSTTVERNGPGSSARPASSRTTPSSPNPAPDPPNSSGTASPVSPSSADSRFHSAASKPVGESAIRRTSASGTADSRNPRTDARRSSATDVATSALTTGHPRP